MTRAQTMTLALAAVLAALAVGWIAGRATHDEAADRTTTATATPERKVLYYRHPMGLPDTSPVPRKDAMGMDYVPVYAGEEEAAAAPGTVVLSPEKIQTLGVRTEPVRRAALAGLVRASGTVEVDETRQYAIAPRFEGWVARLYANQTGMHVRAGQPLLAVYSPQLAAAQQEYRLADATARKLAQSDAASAASMARLRDAARERLRNWEIGDAQLARLGRDGSDQLVLTSPADAIVIEKPVVQGARFAPGDTILRLADLSTVWVIAKVPVAQAGAIVAGQPASFESVALPGRSFSGEVTFVQPVVDAQTRTVDVRIALPNRSGDLRPGLFGTAVLEQPAAQPTLTIPRSAVLDSGTRQIVLLQIAPGRFAPREVTLGQRAGERVEVLGGLAVNEQVVISANFLIDAESNLQSALQGLGAHAGHGKSAGDATPTSAPGPDDKKEPPAGQGVLQAPDPHAGHQAAPAAPAPAVRRPTSPPPSAQPAAETADPHAGHPPAPPAPATPVTPPTVDHGGHAGHEGH